MCGEWEWILMDMLVRLLWEHKRGVFNAHRFMQAEVLIARILSCLCHIPLGLTAPSAHMRCHYFSVSRGHFLNLILFGLTGPVCSVLHFT